VGKRARLWVSIFISLLLLALDCACAGRKTDTTSQPPAEKVIPSPNAFQFDTVTLDEMGKARNRCSLWADSYAEDLGGSVRLEMVHIPAGSFLMGSPESERGRLETEGPQHTVTIPEFYMSKFEVTQAQWRAVASLPKIDRELSLNPSYFKGNELPVEQVSWNEAVEFCKRLSVKTGRAYRLPGEAQWEYAARARTIAPFAFGETITPEIVNYNGEYPYGGAAAGTNRRKTVAVGSLGAANAFGLYDMHGNVEEWCLDNWHDVYAGAPADGSAWTKGGDPEYQLLRGGSCYSSAVYCRAAARNFLGPDYRFSGVGFRVVGLLNSSTQNREVMNVRTGLELSLPKL
jgi:formylglycine-generating enzyme required for sulfatase activity